jgi:putative oxidoreductase
MSTVAPATRPRVNVALWVVQALLAAFYLMGAVPKILGDPVVLEGFALIGFGAAATMVIGLLEVAGAVGLLVPRLCGVAALGFVGLMVGAVLFTVAGIGVGAAVVPAVLLVVVGAVAWARRDRTVALSAILFRRVS